MANKTNVETNKKNTEIKHKKSSELEQKKTTQKKKLRLHSHLKVNIPLFQSLMMILPSLAKHAVAEDVDKPNDETDLTSTVNVTEKDFTDNRVKTSSLNDNHQEAQTSEEHVNSTLSANQAPHGSSSHLVPSHHLSTLSHPQVHYIPSVSMPTIASGSNSQPAHLNTPLTPALPVTFVPEIIKGTYGELHVDASGHYTFVLNPNSPQYIRLEQHQQGTDHFVLHLSNGSSIIVQVPITGKQDAPSISGDLAGVVTEDHNVDSQGLLHANGKIDVIDPDQNESSVAPEVIAGKYGSLTIDADGHWQYQVNNSLSNVQALTTATSLHESFTIHTKDGTPQTIDMTIGGNDDNAVITGVDAGSVTEESQLHTSGTLTVTDVDTGEAHFSNTDIVGSLGTLHLTDAGKWTYDLDNTNPTVQALGKGATATDTITVQSADGTPHQVTITVNGTNDVAIIGGTNSGAVTEESQLQTSGTLTVTDVDTGEAHFSNTDIISSLGTLHLTDSGSWTYDLDNTNPTVQALGQGATATDTITVHSADGTPHQVTITVNGTNDVAIIGGTNSGAVTEESQLQTSGTLTITDVDTGEAHFSNTDITGSLGTLHLTDAGAWTYDLDNTNPNVQALGKGATATDTITVHSADGTPHHVTITVNGTNDKAVIGGTNSGAVTEESQLQTSGTLTVTDVDTGEAHFSNTDIVGSFGTLHLTGSGAWTYDLDNTNPSVQALGKGATATDTITVHSADGTPHQVTITVNGTNDNAVIGGANSGAVTEESQLHTSGTLTITDVDTGEAHFSNTDIVGSLGTLHLTDAGKWTYVLDNTNPTVQALGKGATATDTITVHSADGTPHHVTITVNGTNDNAVISGTNSGAVTEESQLQTSGTLTVTDVDTGEAHFSNTDIVGSLGTLHLTDAGKWTYVLDNTNPTVQALGKGATATDTITVHSADGTPHHVTITVNGTNDNAVIGGTNSGAVTEESQRHTSGTLTITDVDTGEAHFSNTDIVGSLGTLHLTDAGKWTYVLDNTNPTVQALGKGATATDTITVHSTDGTPHHVTITVNGTNDKAVIGSSNSGSVTEESQLHTSGTLTVTDVDTGEAHFSNTDIAGNLGTLHLTNSGAWTYDLDNTNPTVQALSKGATATDTITVHSADGTPHQVAITVNGTNDNAVIGGTNSGSVTEESQLQTSGTLTVTDVDAGEAHFSNTDIAGSLGTLHLTDAGKWTYDLDNTNPNVQALAKGSTATDTITVHSADGTPHHVTITVNGTNDAAVITGSDTGDVDEGHGHYFDMSPDYGKSKLTSEALYADGKLTIMDVDHGQNTFDTKGGGYNYQGQYGRVNLHEDGTWHYMVDIGHNGFTTNTSTTNVGTTIDRLGDGQSLTDTITVYSKDGTSHDIVVTIHGDNDKPYCSSEVQLSSGKEDIAQVLTLNQLLQNTVDVDANDLGQLTIENLHADHGSVAINPDGTFTFTPTKDYNGDVHFTYDVKDAHGGVTHTGATTALAAVADSAQIGGQDTASLEEFGSHASALADMTNQSPDYHQAHNSNLFNQVLSATGHLTVIDPDSGEAEFQGNTNINGQYGHLSLFTNGNWVYEVSAGNSAAGRAIDKLGEGEELTDTITIHSKDGTPHDIVITIHGDNDRPYCSSEVQLNSGTEDTRQTITVTDLLQNTVDVDHNDAGLLTIENLHANHGSIAINKDGSFSFTPEKDYNGDVHFTYDVKDAHGGVTHTGATTNLAAVSDAAIITGDDKGDVSEHQNPNMSPDHAQPGMGILWNNTLHESGQLSITDADAGEASFVTHGSGYGYHGQLGKLHLKVNGFWSYVVDNNAQSSSGRIIDALGAGETTTDTITVESKDGTTHDITITIHGDNDRPYCSSEVQLNSGKEDTAQVLTLSQLLQNTVEVDANDVGKLSIDNLHADHGSIAVNTDGTFTFTPNQDYNGDVHFTYDVKDAHGGVTHTGATTNLAAVNDASSLDSTLSSTTVTEDQTSAANQLSSSWKNLAVTDVDNNAEAAIVQIEVNGVLHQVPADFAMSLQGDHGTFFTTHGTDGYDKWRYTADNTHSEIQGLKDGQSLTDSITLITADGTRIPITATIQGTDDHVIIDTPNAVTASLGTAIEDTKTSISGMLAAHDVDTDDTVHFEVQSTAGSYGTLSVSQDGSWHYDLDHTKANQLNPWDNIPEIFNVVAVSSDGSKATQRIQINVQGTADAAVINGVDTGSIIEDHHIGSSSAQTIAVSGLLTVTDPDAGQDYFQFSQFGEQAVHDPFGGNLRITPSGNWGYWVPNSALQYLHEGDVEHVVYRVYSVDGTSHDITITVNGTNDAPVLTAQTQSVTEDGGALQGQMHATDVDYNGRAFLSFAIANPVDGLTFNSDGSYTFDPSHAAYQHLGAGQDQTLTIPVTVKDEVNATSTQNLTIIVHGTNDGAIITGQHKGSVTEDSHVASGGILVTQGVLVSNDPDTSDIGFTGEVLQTLKDGSAAGVLQMGKSGTWIYTVDNQSVQSMAAGETKNEIFEVKSIDGTPHEIEVTITGSNDAPALGVTQTTHSSGTLTETDVDTSDTHTFSVVQGAGNFGTLSVDPQTGAYTYTPSGSVQGMYYHSQQGHYVGVDTFEIKVADNQGEESSEFITFGAQGVVTAPTGSSTTPTITTSVPSPAIVTATAPVTGANPAVSNTVTLDLANSSDTGSSDTDNLTQDTTPTIDGHTDIPFSQVTIYDGSKNAIGYGTSDASGGFSITVSAISDGVHHFTASALDPSAATPTISSTLDITVDTQADIRVNMMETPSGNTIHSIQLYMAQDVTPTSLQLVDEHGTRVTVDLSVHDTPQASLRNPDHNYVTYHGLDISTLSGRIHVEVDGVDTAGNAVQDHSGAKTVQALSAIGVSLTHDTGTDTTDHITSDGSLSVSGQDHGTSLQYSIDGGHHWLSSFTPTQGPNTVEVHQISPTGSTSTGASLTFSLDNQALAPTVSLASDSGSSKTDLLTNNGTLTVSGTEANAVVEYSIDNGQNWSSSFTPVEGLNNVQVRQTDSAGNVSPSSTISYTLDTHAGTVSLNTIAQDDVINAQESGQDIVFTGTTTGMGIGDYVVIRMENNSGYYRANVQSDGSFSVALHPGDYLQHIHEGSNTLHVIGYDQAGNHTALSAHPVSMDTTNPIPHISVDPVTPDNVLNAAESGQTISITGHVSGDFVAGDAVSLKINGLVISSLTGTVDAQGNFDIPVSGRILARANIHTTYGSGQPAQIHSVEATIVTTDSAGNTGTATTGEQVFDLDTTAPTVASGSTGQTVEDTTTSASGTLVATNADHIIWQANAPQAGSYGTLSFDEHAGTWTYQLDHNKANSLTAHENHGETFTVNGADAAGNVIHQTITVNVQGTDDLPVISGSQLGDVIEASGANLGIAQISGDLSASDVDASGTFHWSVVNSTGSYGGLCIDDTGHWQYTLDNTKANSLGQGQVKTEDFEVEVMSPDGGKMTQHVTVSVQGTLDAPTLTATQESTTFSPVLAEADFTQSQGNQDIELLGYQTTNIVSGGKLDISAASSQLVTHTGSGIGVKGVGNDQFNAGRSQEINTGETLLLHLNGAARTAIIQLSGFDNTTTLPHSSANDKAHWMAFDDSGKLVGEGDVLPTLDHNGRFEITTTSAFSYITVQAEDNGGGNSRFYIERAEANLIQYDTKVNLVGQLSDVSNTDALAFHVTGVSASASFNHGTKEADGSWTITATQAQNLHLSHAADLHLQIVAIATDSGETTKSSVATLDVTSQGMKYTTVSGVHKASVTEDNTQDVSEQLHIDTNVAGTHTFVAQQVTTASGDFAITSDGHWTFHVNSQVLQTMNTNDVKHEIFTVQTNTGESIPVQVDVHGKDDPTILGGTLTAVMTEGQTTDSTGHITLSDIDTVVNPAVFLDISQGQGNAGMDYSGTYGTLHVSPDGSWKYTLDPTKTDQLQAGEIAHETINHIITGTISHNNQQTLGQIDIEIHGSNDAPIISGATSGNVEEDSQLQASGQLHITDVDTGADGMHSEASFTALTDQIGDQGYGHFNIDKNGNWHYDLDNSAQKVQGLATGQQVTDTLTVTSADGTPQVITVDIQGHDETIASVNPHPAPPAPTPSQAQHDAPDDVDSFTVDLVADSASEARLDISALQDASIHSEQSSEIAPTTGASAYLDVLGISPNAQGITAPQQPLPDDIDIVLTHADQLAAEHDLSTGLDLSDALAQDDHQHALKDDDQDNLDHQHFIDLPNIDPNS